VTFELRHARGATRHFYGEGAVEACVAELGPALAGRRAFVVSSRPILDLHSERLLPLRQSVGRVDVLEVPDGELAKTLAEAERLWRELLAGGGKRDSLIVAFGGGSVGDLAGFVAGGFLRGVDWLAVPTTLLAQVDAAIGGKTAVDLPEAKNAVGVFHHPLAVAADPAVLATLAPDLRRAGLVEALKVGAIANLELFERIEADLDRLAAGDRAELAAVAARAARAKARLVERDPEERGRRKLLNFGHTLGHAIEAEIGYGRIAHGDAVAHGIRFALAISTALGGDAGFAARVQALIDRLAPPALPPLDPERLAARAGLDKKARERGLGWVLLDGPGRGSWDRAVPDALVAAELRRLGSAGGGRPP
jgi:3-dehydroquinate synthase